MIRLEVISTGIMMSAVMPLMYTREKKRASQLKCKDVPYLNFYIAIQNKAIIMSKITRQEINEKS